MRCAAAGPCQAVVLPRAALDGLDAPQLTKLLDVEAADAALQVCTEPWTDYKILRPLAQCFLCFCANAKGTS